MEALVMAGGKGTRMGKCGLEKPLQVIGVKHTVMRVVEALSGSKNIDRVLVSVSSNTPGTERYLKNWSVETIRTSGEGYVEDLHAALSTMSGKYVISSPSDLPLLRTYTIDAFIDFFNKKKADSAIAVVDKDTVINTGIMPSYLMELGGKEWVISGLCILDREKTLSGQYLDERYFKTDWVDLAINVNTNHELEMTRQFFADYTKYANFRY
ncbi:MAG: NTP transferase domain-containing protein [Candidatus Methanomethylophilaceae archaeon]